MESESDNIERTKLLHATDSAAVWAEEWCKVAREITVRDGWTALLDEGWMIGWFANAIEVAKDLQLRSVENPTASTGWAARGALMELGVPTEDYPAPVANAVALLAAAVHGRCSPENPCWRTDDNHLTYWGECFVASYERIVNFGPSQDSGEPVTAVTE